MTHVFCFVKLCTYTQTQPCVLTQLKTIFQQVPVMHQKRITILNKNRNSGFLCGEGPN